MSVKMRESTWDRHGVVERMLKDTPLPKMFRVRQKLNDRKLEDIPGEIRKQLHRPEIAASIRPGMSIAVTVGSRGIAHIALITREIIRNLRELGAQPFVIPAMGSHGGGSAEGQREMIEGMGVTEDYIGAPIRSSMDTVQVSTLNDGRPVFIDRYASEADGIIIVGRVKPHTAFRGEYESGLFKMMAIGLAKHKGAEACHSQGFRKMAENVPLYARAILENANILFGVAIIENSHDHTCSITSLTKEEIPAREPGLLREARELMARIYIEEIDVLVVDEIGKNHSGDGMDPNITGSYCTPFASGPPRVGEYVVLDISEETHGNALGVGMATYTTQRVFEKADFDTMYPNALTARVAIGIRMPMVLKNDRLAMQAALYVAMGNGADNPRLVRIPNSSHVDEIWLSESLLEKAKADPNLIIESEPAPMAFDADGNLIR